MHDANDLMDQPEPEKLLVLLSDIVDCVNSKSSERVADKMAKLLVAVDKAGMYLRQLRACEFVSDNGATCYYEAVEVTYGLRCCEHHARIRRNSLI